MEEAGVKLVAQGADQFYRDMNRAGQSVDDFAGDTERASNRAGGAFGNLGRLASGALGGVGTLLGGIATAAAGATLAVGGGLVAAVGGAALAGLSFNNSVEQATARINAFTKDSGKTAEILAMVEERAAKTPFAFSEMANAAAALGPSAKSAQIPLEELIGTAEILAASNPAEGLEGAAFAIKEALSGDFTSAIERFNLSRSYINQLREEGVPDLEVLSMAMQQAGYDADLVSQLAETAQGRLSTFLDTFTSLAGTVTQPIFEAFSSGLGEVNRVLEENAPALEGIAQSLSEKIAPYAAAAGAAVGEFAGDVINVVGALADAGPTSDEFQQALSRLPEPLAGAISGIALFASALSGNEEAMGKLPGTVQVIIGAIQGVPGAFEGAKKAVADFFSTPLGTAIKDAASGLGDYLLNDFGPDVAGAMADGRKALDDFFATPLGTMVKDAAAGLADYLTGDFLGDVQKAAEGATGALEEFADSPWGVEIRQGAGVVADYFTNEWPGQLQRGIGVAQRALDEVAESDWWQRVQRGAGVVGDFMANEFPERFQRGFERVKGWIDSGVRWLEDAATDYYSGATGIGANIVAGIISGLDSASGGLFSKITGIVATALAKAQGAAEIKSPSQLFAREVGVPITQGIAEGVLSAVGEAEAAIEKLGDGMEEKAKELAERITEAFKTGIDFLGALGGSVGGLSKLQEDLFEAEERYRAARDGTDPAEYLAAQQGLRAAQAAANRAFQREEQAQQTALQIGAMDPARAAAFLSQRTQQLAAVADLEERIAAAQAQGNATGVNLLQRQLGLLRERQGLELRALAQGAADPVQQLISGAALSLLGGGGGGSTSTVTNFNYSPSYGGPAPNPSQDFAAMRLMSA